MIYFIDKIPDKDGFHLIHNNSCLRRFFTSSIIYLGDFDTCEKAFETAQKVYSKVKFCSFCLPECIEKEEPIYKPNRDLFN
ncbi:MAG: hypothetical protein PHC46_01870 [Clostridia bacterium]|nr:hypothetical protein [Clostridia bacterium]